MKFVGQRVKGGDRYALHCPPRAPHELLSAAEAAIEEQRKHGIFGKVGEFAEALVEQGEG